MSGTLRHAFWAALAALLSNAGCANQEIWLLSLQPFTGEWDMGISMRVGAEIMLREINANPRLLPGYELRVAWQDSLCAYSGGQLYFKNLMWSRYDMFAPGKEISELDADGDGVITTADVEPFKQVWNSSVVAPVGLLGCACTAPTEMLAWISPTARMPHISNGATYTDLSDRSSYPNFFRTVMPDLFLIPALFALTKDLGISTVTSAVDEYGFARTAARLVAEAAALGIELKGNDLSSEVPGFKGARVRWDKASAEAAVANFIQYQQRVVILLVYGSAVLRLVLCEAYKRRFQNAVYMGYAEFLLLALGGIGHDTDCTPWQLAGMAAGQIGAAHQFIRTDAAAQLSCSGSMTAQQFEVEWWRRQNATPGDYTRQPAGFVPSVYAGPTADAVCMFAQALHDVMLTRNVTVSELVERTPSAYAAMVDAFAKTDFEGVSGRIRFAPGSGDVLGTASLQQLQYSGGTLKSVDMASFNQKLSYHGQGTFVFQFPGERFFAGPAGASSIGANLSQFVTCADDQVLDTGANRCVPCPANTTFVERDNTCLCKAGFFETASGECEPCPAGGFSSTAGSRSCQLCGPGTFAPPGSDKCSFCPRGSFANSSGLGACHSCPPLQTTLEIASESRGACLCSAGSYNDGSHPDGDPRSLCLPCKEGMSCPAGSDLRGYDPQHAAQYPVVPLLGPGYWSSREEPLSVFRCHDDVRCPGYRVPGGPCAENFEQQRCGACKAGYEQSGSSCSPCPARTAQALLFPVLPVAILSVMICLLYRLDGTPYARWGSWMKGAAATFFITLSHYHIVSIIQGLNIIPNRSVSDTLGSVSVLSDVTSVFSPQCNGFSSFMSQLVLKSHAPAFIFLVYAAVWLASRLVGLRFKSLRMEPNRLLNGFLSIILTFFTSVADMTFTIFKCSDNPNGVYTLVMDRSITCYEDQWMGMLGVGIAAVLVWCVGLALLLLHAICVAPTRFHSRVFQTRWAFLFVRYRSDVHWWALVVIARGVVLNIGTLFIAYGVGQVYWIVAVLIAYTFLLFAFRPWRHNLNNYVDFYVHLCLFWTCALAVWFSHDAAVLNAEMQNVVGEHMVKGSIASAAAPFIPVVAVLWWAGHSSKARRDRDSEGQAILCVLGTLTSLDFELSLEFLREIAEHDFALMSQAKDMLLTELGEKRSRWGYSSGSFHGLPARKASGLSAVAAPLEGDREAITVLGPDGIHPCDLVGDRHESGPSGHFVGEDGGDAADCSSGNESADTRYTI